MSLNINYFDLRNNVWTPKEFEQQELKVEQGDKLKLIYEKNISPPTGKKPSYPAGVFAGIKYWTSGKAESDSLYAVSDAINKISQEIIQEEINHWQNIQNSSSTSKEKQLEVVKETFKHLENLKKNLENHDVVVKEFNERFIFKEKVVGCPNHQKVLAEVEEKLTQLDIVKMILEKSIVAQQQQKVREFNQQLDILASNLENGLKIDKELILRAYPQLIEIAQKLGIPPQHPSIHRLHYLLNSYYVANLIENIAQKRIPVPTSISVLLHQLGMDNMLSSQITEAGRQELIKKLESYIKPENPALLEIPSTDFVRKIQKDFLEIATTHLARTPSEKLILRPLIEQLYLFEIETQQTMQQAEQSIRKEIEDMVTTLPATGRKIEQQKQYLLDKWRSKHFPSLMPKLMEQFFKQIKLNQLPSPNDNDGLKNFQINVEKAFQRMKKQGSLENLKNQYNKAVALPFLDDMVKELAKTQQTWFEKNASARRFNFNQGQWGSQQIFGSGVCAAINYRWIRHLMQHPSQKVTSAEDLGYQEKKEKEFVQQMVKSPAYQKIAKEEEQEQITGISAKDRKNFATYALGFKLEGFSKPEDKYSIGSTIMKKDRVEYHLVETKHPSIDKLIDNLVQKHPEALISTLTNGIFDISIFKVGPNIDPAGHAIGMQIDPTRDIYRFWDVNSGFYQYSTLEEMKTAFKEYMDEFYGGEYNSFHAGQYSPIL
jgi:hypothetical protein